MSFGPVARCGQHMMTPRLTKQVVEVIQIKLKLTTHCLGTLTAWGTCSGSGRHLRPARSLLSADEEHARVACRAVLNVVGDEGKWMRTKSEMLLVGRQVTVGDYRPRGIRAARGRGNCESDLATDR